MQIVLTIDDRPTPLKDIMLSKAETTTYEISESGKMASVAYKINQSISLFEDKCKNL